MSSLRESTDTIVSKVYYAIMIEYNTKFKRMDQALKGIRNQIENLEESINKIKMKFDILDQDRLLDSVVFHGVKQQSWMDIQPAVLHTLNQKCPCPRLLRPKSLM